MRKTIVSYIKQILRIDESRKMSREERTIKNLETFIRKRNVPIIVLSVMLLMMLFASICTFRREYELNKIKAPFLIKSMSAFENPMLGTPSFFSRFYLLTGTQAKVITYKLYFGLLTGVITAMLIYEIGGFTKNKHILTLSMWQKIKQLENEVKELKAHASSNDQEVDDFDREDTSG